MIWYHYRQTIWQRYLIMKCSPDNTCITLSCKKIRTTIVYIIKQHAKSASCTSKLTKITHDNFLPYIWSLNLSAVTCDSSIFINFNLYIQSIIEKVSPTCIGYVQKFVVQFCVQCCHVAVVWVGAVAGVHS